MSYKPLDKYLKFRLEVHKSMEWNDHKAIKSNGMKWNKMYLKKGKEWKKN